MRNDMKLEESVKDKNGIMVFVLERRVVEETGEFEV